MKRMLGWDRCGAARARAALGAVLLLAGIGRAVTAEPERDLPEQIRELTRRISQEPRQAAHYLARGDLYRAQEKWDASQADFDYAAGLNPKLEITDFYRGRMFLEANWPLSAKATLDRFLAKQTNHVEALVLRARTWIKLGNRLAAAEDLTRAIRSDPEARPELYLERAQTLVAEGGPYLQQALDGLEEGVRKLGSLVNLQLSAIDIEVKQQQYDRALTRLAAVAASSPRQETWLARKGEILQAAGRTADARAAYRAALSAMEKLPPARRNVPAMLELQKRIQAELEKLK